MIELFGVPLQALVGQLILGLVTGSFYAVLSLGLAVIFGMLNVINFSHGSMYMMGAFGAWMALNWLGLGYWWSLLLVPLAMVIVGIIIERLLLRWIYGLDHLYGLLLTFGLALIIDGIYREKFGSGGLPYPIPQGLEGSIDLGFMMLPYYRCWVVVASLVICLLTWLIIERTRLGSYLRAAIENQSLVQAFGVNVPLMLALTYGLGVALASFAGVVSSPVVQVNPLLGAHIIIVVFAVVVIGGLGSILGSIVTGLSLGVIEGLAKVFYPQVSSTIVFIIMAIVLIVKPAGLFGRE